MMLYDVVWCYMMLYDVIWSYLILNDHIWCYMMLYNAVCCNMMLWCWLSISVIEHYCGFSKTIQYPVDGGGGHLLWKLFFSQISGGALSTFIHLSLGKAGPFTLESHIHVKALKCKVFQIIRCLIRKQHPDNFSSGYSMSGPDTQ